MSPIKQLRVMANFGSDLTAIKENIGILKKDFKLQNDLAKKFNENFDLFADMILDLEEQFKRVRTINLIGVFWCYFGNFTNLS